MEKRDEKRATAAALGANAIFGFSFMFSRMALAVISPELLLAARFLIAFLCINAAAILLRQKRDVPEAFRFHLKGKPILPLLALGLLQPVVYFLCESHGIDRTNVTVSGVLIALIPVAAVLMGVPMLKERFSLKQAGYVLLSLAGVILMILPQGQGERTDFLGVVLLLGAVVSGALFNVLSRRMRADYSSFERTYVMMGMGALIFTALALARGEGRNLASLLNPRLCIPLLYLGFVSSIGAFLLLNYANSYLPVAKTTSFANLTTVLSVFAGTVILREPFHLTYIPATAMILIGVTGVQRTKLFSKRA